MSTLPIQIPSILKKLLMSLTGIVLVGFVTMHMLGNLQIFAGAEAINLYAHTLQSLPPPVKWGGRLFLLFCVGVHFGAAALLVVENYRARPVRYTETDYRATTPASRTMPYTGAVLIAFVFYHLLHFTVRCFGDYDGRFGDRWTLQEGALAGTKVMDVYAMMVAGFGNPLISLFYLVAMALLCLHLAHGFQSMFQTLGFMSAKWRERVEKIGIGFAAVIFIGFAAIPVAVLLGGMGSKHMKRYEKPAAHGIADPTPQRIGAVIVPRIENEAITVRLTAQSGEESR